MIAKLNGDLAVLTVEVSNDLVIVREQSCTWKKSTVDGIMVVMEENEADILRDFQLGSLMHFHRKLAHLSYDTIIEFAWDPGS